MKKPFLIGSLVAFIMLPLTLVAQTIHISGKVYYDNNADNVLNSNDSVFAGGIVIAVNNTTGVKTTGTTNNQGAYSLAVIAGSYTISVYETYNSEDYLILNTVTGNYTSTNPYQLDFAIQPQPDLPIQITGRAYYDNNKNQRFDAGDSAVVRGQVNVVVLGGYEYVPGFTDAHGRYHVRRNPGSYQVILRPQTYDIDNYILHQDYVRTYTFQVSDTINFALQPKDSVAGISVDLYPDDGSDIPAGGGSRNFTARSQYGGALLSMPVDYSLDFNPLLQVTPAITPTVSKPGHIEWKGTTLLNSIEYRNSFTVIFPPVGDTIDAFGLHYTMKPQYKFSNVEPIMERELTQQVMHGAGSPIGASKGIKWLRTFNGLPYESQDRAYSIDTAHNGAHLFIAGYKTAPFNGMFIAMLDKNGLSVWERYVSELFPQWIERLVIRHTKDGGCIISGTAYESNADIVVAKFDAAGNMQWSKTLAGSRDDGSDNENDIVELPNGYLVTGTTWSRDGDFSSTHMDDVNSNVFVARLSGDGTLLWQKQYGGKQRDKGIRAIPLKNGNFLVLATTQSMDGDVKGAHTHALRYINNGYFNSHGEYIDGIDSVLADEAWVLNLDANGNMLWNKCYGGTEDSRITGAAEANGGYVLSGLTNSKDGDLSHYEEASIPLWLLQVSGVGNITWSKQYRLYGGYKNDDYLESHQPVSSITRLHKVRDGNYVVALTSNDRYGAIKSLHGSADIILVKLKADGSILSQKAIGGTGSDYVYDIQVDKNDDIIFAGSTISENDDCYEPLNNAYELMLVGKAGIVNTISGKVFIDINGNHIQDNGEPLFSEGNVTSYKAGDTITARIFDGRYLNKVDTGDYTTKYVVSTGYYTAYPVQQATTFTGSEQEATVDLALTPTPGIHDLQTTIIATIPASSGSATGLRIVTKNVGTTAIPNVVIKLKKPSTAAYISSTRTTSTITSDTITFSMLSMPPGAADTLNINLGIANSVKNGDTLAFTAVALPQVTDATPGDNQASLREMVRNSFEANDKTEAHGGLYTSNMQAAGEPFHYLVRFQNNTADTAFYVTVKDTLDDRIDIRSLKTVSSSHPYTFSIEGNIATWQFNKIKLVNAATNDAGSHGYISFTIEPAGELQTGDSIVNKAAIYFDFNLPVITNSDRLAITDEALTICPGGGTQLQAGKGGTAYQWQVDTGNGFADVSNNGTYAGVTTSTLSLNNVPSVFSGYQYRCVVKAGGSTTNGNIYKLSFVNTWTGITSTAWETASNWSCGSVPDQYTDVVIKADAINQPAVNSTTAVCKSIHANDGSHVWIKVGAKLEVMGR